MSESRKEAWRNVAEHAAMTKRSFEKQLEYLSLSPELLKGKTVLVLGPGKDYAFERGAQAAGAELVVAYSYRFDRHKELSPMKKSVIKPVKGLFQELPPAYSSFDYIVSSFGFPMYLSDLTPQDSESAYRAEHKVHFQNLIDLLSPGGEARLIPVYQEHRRILHELQTEHPGSFDVEFTTMGDSTLAIICKKT